MPKPDMRQGDICPECKESTMRKIARKDGSGFFLGCSGYPNCRYCCGLIETDADTADTIKSLQAMNSDLRRQIVVLKDMIRQLEGKPPADTDQPPAEGQIPF